ncbi:hypothetical protein DACRYDRAFT_107954 [Dacryopinax primogenitus]|uniref:Uncharacterized protein n=1 Tax=Dacryopinax primogenitus (strain DJM 731) TaxID=1858805 RepID=M5G6E9_DACPD|nr:uncharacterized protein DACRYDRAFT_107954 [Dacryopinax primogenitus]EJU01402.1 hypothetical protein DACRYDRAFT_107954 [Dacryopinax primogenitus]
MNNVTRVAGGDAEVWEEVGDEEDEEEEQEEEGDEADGQSAECLLIYHKIDNLPHYLTPAASMSTGIMPASPSSSPHPSPPPTPCKKSNLPVITTFYIPTSAEVHVAWEDCNKLQDFQPPISAPRKHTTGFLACMFKHSKHRQHSNFTIPPLCL